MKRASAETVEPHQYRQGCKKTKPNPRTGRLQRMRAAIPAPVERGLSRLNGRLRLAAAGGFRRSGKAPLHQSIVTQKAPEFLGRISRAAISGGERRKTESPNRAFQGMRAAILRLWSAASPGLTGDCALRRQADFGAQAKRLFINRLSRKKRPNFSDA